MEKRIKNFWTAGFFLPAINATVFSGPNNGVVLNKHVGWIFSLPFIGENACLWKNFKSYQVKKKACGWEFFGVNK